ncbi:hypothetical protein HY379_02775 [Candidatus Saccharibacteria bacterium]|nr:hypothetical protein [Candidatus Saccharibacteria bacterium]
MSEKRRFEPVLPDDESKELFRRAQEVYATGGVEALAELLADGDQAMVDEYMRHIESLQGTESGVVEAVLHRIEDERILSDPDFQESLRQAEAGELIDITPDPEAMVENLMDRARESKEGPETIEGPH